jgi:Pyruvate/2-oxoacid:ferredoxin oxidoreductase delta subunit
MLSTNNEQTERRTEYAGKRIPVRRELLNLTRNKSSQELANLLHTHFDSYVLIEENCTKCQGCVAICPTGALKTETTEETPMIEQLLCTGCGLCQEFCLGGALTIQHD